MALGLEEGLVAVGSLLTLQKGTRTFNSNNLSPLQSLYDHIVRKNIIWPRGVS